MNMVNISVSEAAEDFSLLVDAVRRGESVLITDGGRPFAELSPRFAGEETDPDIARLIEKGIVRPPRGKLDKEKFLAEPLPRLADGCSASALVIAEREESW